MFGRGPRLPSLEVTDVSFSQVRFTLSNTDVSVANALRRIMIAEVPTLAIELVTLTENTSCLHDEFIVHRMGLLPIDSRRVREFNYKEECPCADKCNKCSVEYSLDVECDGSQPVAVTHQDLTGTDPHPDAPMPVPRSDQGGPLSGGIVLAKLARNQKLKCTMVAVKGIGKLHAKWIPAATAVFQYEPEITLHRKLLATVPASTKQRIVQSCPRDVFAYEEDTYTGQAELDVRNKLACVFCDECVQAAAELGCRDLVKVTPIPDKFHFTVESTGVMPAEQIVEMAIEVLEQKLKTVSDSVHAAQGTSAGLAGGLGTVPEESGIQLDLD